jgi:hypothetical protein
LRCVYVAFSSACFVLGHAPTAAVTAAAQARNAAAHGRLDREPMFCFESAIKLFFWSCLVYEDYKD